MIENGGPPRVLLRVEQPFGNHNGGYIAFNPLAMPGDPDFGHLYVGVADGGSGGDPMNLSPDLGRVFGKILRVDPLGDNSRNGHYGIPLDNPFAGAGEDVLGEIFALGLRNPQGLAWDPRSVARRVGSWISWRTRRAGKGGSRRSVSTCALALDPTAGCS